MSARLAGGCALALLAALALPVPLALGQPPARVAAAAADTDPLAEALALVVAQSETVAAAQLAATIRGQSNGWTSAVRIGYAQKGDQDALTGAGFNAGISVSIPLFDRRHEIEAAQARAQAWQVQDQLADAFLRDVKALVLLALGSADALELEEFERDHLSYQREQVTSGLLEAAQLWAQAGAAKKAAQATRRGRIEYRAELERIARRYGGSEWPRLRDLVAAVVQRER